MAYKILQVVLSLCCLLNSGFGHGREHNQIENELFENQNFMQGRADMVFLLDRSGSVGAANFEIEKGFVESLLTHVAVDANATRVAVISYSNVPELHINYISNPKTKCHLSQELQDVEYRDSGATNTAAALQEARKVLLDGRPSVNKVVIIMTDGISTAGDDPVVAAEQLKKDTGAQIFAFGIGKYLGPELASLATSSKHVYNCEGFQEFKRLARKIRGDPHEKSWSSDSTNPNCDHLCDSPYKGEANDPGCCDHHAKCSCALLSGMHTCVCLPGYFGLDGTWGGCIACPRGTYKSTLEPSKACTPCPPGATTVEKGAKSIRDCHCEDGYSGDPGNGESCTGVKCPPLQQPTHGYIMNHCDNSFGAECLYMCEEGYEFDTFASDIRTCQKNGQWSGSPPVCRKTLCNRPEQPVSGRMTCERNELTVGMKCSFSCSEGYILQGSQTRTCLSNKQWTGQSARCVAIQCPPPKDLQFGKILNCRANINLVYKQACLFRCNYGYELKGPGSMMCNKNGKLMDYWNPHSQILEPFCQDVTNPEIKCPKNIFQTTKSGRNFADVTWELPTADDNSGSIPKIISSPTGFKPPRKFPIGTTSATYTAIDRSGRQSSCQFSVTILDKEPPRVLSCPSTVKVNTTDTSAEVFWEEPIFNDNSLGTLDIYKNFKPGDTFEIGRHVVFYDARDPSGNLARCHFDIIVSRNYCPYYPPPINGAFVCDEWMYGEFCQVQCNYQHEFFSTPADWYICNSDARWETIPEGKSVPWPDCTRKTDPHGVRKMFRGYYYQGNCNDPRVQHAIRSSFLYLFQTTFSNQIYCQTEGACTLEMVKVTCGEIERDEVKRWKRDIQGENERENLNIELDILINTDEKVKLPENAFQDFLNTVESLNWNLDEELRTLSLKSDNFTDGELGYFSLTSTEASLLCPPGAVRTQNECALCPAGTYHNQIQDKCVTCFQGEYQDVEGQTECVKCPPGMSTENDNSKNGTDCKGECQAGTFSVSGLETCISCPVGSFQNESKQTKCKLCPDGTTTAVEGAASSEDCQKACRPGTYSETGLEPCILCPLGYYQNFTGETDCKECHANLTTLSIGSSSILECVDYNPCNNISYCKNGGTCLIMDHEPICQCFQGFDGDYCEHDINECFDEPCLNGGSCINEVGGFSCQCENDFRGNFCEEEVKPCESNPCFNNGTCQTNNEDYFCLCPIGFEGAHCEKAIESCGDIICLNGGVCSNEVDSTEADCQCANGFTGADCSININDCYNVTCYNGGSCIDEINSFRCACRKGFAGMECEINVNDCENHECYEGSTCIDLIGHYECSCPPGWDGSMCEHKMNTDFVLHFPDHSTLANMATATLRSPLPRATISMWIQTNDIQRSGTPFSYASAIEPSGVKNDEAILDNALTVSDCSALSVYINNEQLLTDISVNDGSWHHFAFTWSSETGGEWRAYKDGMLQSFGKGLQANKIIPSGGRIVLGQEQDDLDDGFSPLESFSGNITRLNIWNRFLSDQNVFQLYELNDDVPGKVIAWPDFLQGIDGNTQVLRETENIMLIL